MKIAPAGRRLPCQTCQNRAPNSKSLLGFQPNTIREGVGKVAFWILFTPMMLPKKCVGSRSLSKNLDEEKSSFVGAMLSGRRRRCQSNGRAAIFLTNDGVTCEVNAVNSPVSNTCNRWRDERSHRRSTQAERVNEVVSKGTRRTTAEPTRLQRGTHRVGWEVGIFSFQSRKLHEICCDAPCSTPIFRH